LYKASNALEIFYIGVDARYRRYGIARSLLGMSIDMAPKIALDRRVPQPEIAFAVFTSNYSQALAEQFDFEWLHAIRYDEYECSDGKLLSERIGNVHQSSKLGARRL
jgi:ribosomal protein S18 acetylase RimI-like enzyme